MKLTTLLIVLAVLTVYASSNAQSISLSGHNIPLKKVFDAIKEQTGHTFFYRSDDLKIATPISLDLRNATLPEALRRVFEKQQLTYDIQGMTVFVTKKTGPVLLDEVRGRVVDSLGSPLPGASVRVLDAEGKRTGLQTTADDDGRFSLADVPEDARLEITYVGYWPREISLSEIGEAIILRTIKSEIAEVGIYSTGYQEIARERSTGSFERINPNILNGKISQDIFAKLEGEVAGLTTDASGSFIIRGLSSINANTAPLIVVDGFPLEQGSNTINPNEVESITVLKDAAAASIWGIRATNGVIVITTKKGSRTGKLSVTASVNTSITPKPDLFAVPLGDPATQVAYQQALYENGDFYQTSQLFSGILNNSSGRVINPVAEVLLLRDRGDITVTEAEQRLQRLIDTDIRNEYLDLIQQREQWRNYNVSISGGRENYDFTTSASYNGNDRQFQGTGANQYLLKFAHSLDLTRKLKVDGSLSFSQLKENLPISTTADGITSVGVVSPTSFLNSVPLTGRILDEAGNYLPMQSTLSFGSESSQLALGQGFPYDWTYNIKQELENTDNVLRETALRVQSGLSYTILNGLDLTMRYQYEWTQENGRDFHNERTLYTRARVNLFTKLDANGTAIANPMPVGAILDLDMRNLRSHTFRSQLNFDRTFDGGRHQVIAIAGYEVRKTLYDRVTDRKYGFDEQSLASVNPDYVSTFQASVPLTILTVMPANSINEYLENRFISYYANAAYTFDHRYTVSASTRLDDTNLFGTSDKYKDIPLYSFGVKWNIYKDFLYSSEVVDDLQFRVTYGTNGNVDRSTSPFLQARVKRGFPPYTGYNADIISVPNPELRLEKTRTLNIGADFTLFNRFVNGSIEYYVKDSEDLLAFTTLNPTLGVTGALINNGTLRNEGADLNLSFRILKNGRFNYSTTGIFSVNRNTLKKVDVPNKQIFEYVNGSVAEAGAALRTIYSYVYKGLDSQGAPLFMNEHGELVDFKTHINNTDALVKHGSLIPVYYGSWINTFTYNRFSLRTLTTFKAGHVFRYARNNNVTYIPASNPSTPYANVAADFNRRWQQPGDEHTTDIPALPAFADRTATGFSYYRDSDKFVDGASAIRLSQLSLAYNLSDQALTRLGLHAVRIGLQGDNIAVWNFNRWDVDPESTFIPVAPTYTFNISLSF